MINPALGFDPKALIQSLIQKGEITVGPPEPDPETKARRLYHRLYKRDWRERRRLEGHPV